MKTLLVLGLLAYVCYRFGRAVVRFGQRLFGWVEEGYRREGDMHIHYPPTRSRKGDPGGDYVDYEEVK
jgi:hypothetical protein